MLTSDESEEVRLGGLAIELMGHPGWLAYSKAVENLKRVYAAQALTRGDTNFEKGAVYAIDLVMTCLDATIDRRKELLAREASLRATRREDEESGPEVMGEAQAERVP